MKPGRFWAKLGQPRDRVWLIALIAAFIASRLLFHRAGVRFDMTPLGWYWQYIDPALLRSRLLESIYYLHSQPPLFNLFLGIVLKTFPGREALVFSLAYKGMGLCIVLSIFLLMRRLGIRAFLACGLGIAFLASPASILYENWLFYTYPLAAMMCLSAVVLNRFLNSGRSRYAALFFALVAVMVLTRSLFHLLWFLAIMCGLLLARRNWWRQIILAGLVPLAAICCLYAKNLTVFGSFSSSTWLGFSISKMTTFRLSEDVRRDLVAEGVISEFSLIEPFSTVDAYAGVVSPPEETGIPVLDQKIKSVPHRKPNVNFNNLIFVEISDRYRKDAFAVMRNRPRVYLRSVAIAWGLYFLPASDYRAFTANAERIRPLDTFYNRFLYGQTMAWSPRGEISDYRGGHFLRRLSDIGFLLIAGFVVFIAVGWRFIRRSATDHRASAIRLTFLFIYLSVIYVTLVGNCVEIGENNRFRLIIDPFILVGVGLGFNMMLNRFRTRPS